MKDKTNNRSPYAQRECQKERRRKERRKEKEMKERERRRDLLDEYYQSSKNFIKNHYYH